MRWLWILPAVLSLPSVARADHFEQRVSFQCDQLANRLVIEHHGVWNNQWDQVHLDSYDKQWDIRALFAKDENGNGQVGTSVDSNCKLHSNNFEFSISGVCQGHMCTGQTAHIVIRNGKRTLFNQDFQKAQNGPVDLYQIITRIVVSGSAEIPDVLTTTWDPKK